MKASVRFKALFAALTLSAVGSAFADTSLDTTNGSIVLNVVDTTNNTSFLFDTGLKISTWADTNYSFDLSGDSNFAAFLAGRAGSGDALSYDLIAVTPAAGTIHTVFSTADAAPGILPVGNTTAQAVTAGTSYMQAINNIVQTSTNSAYAGTSAVSTAYWGTNQPTWSSKLGNINDLAQLGSAINFFSFVINGGARSGTADHVAQFLSQWNFTQGGLLTYGSAVPLPASWVLLLCGLGLMVVIARRGKSERGFGGGAAA
ncbi:MAG TPA: VPLPA-CTERM sorting domain-containing protein [Nevskia sp.]|nr:VPLPA-CTERM sorting domain-containing protein [Nevskia sp.]